MEACVEETAEQGNNGSLRRKDCGARKKWKLLTILRLSRGVIKMTLVRRVEQEKSGLMLNSDS
jgi:hypothetical protein